MKRVLILLSSIIVIAVVLVYTLIPENIIVSKIVYTNIKSASVLRCLHDTSKWQQWFPANVSTKNDFTYNNQHYTIKKQSYISSNVIISDNKINYPSVINVIPIMADSSIIEWKLQFNASKNIFKRIDQYQAAKKLKNNMTVLLDSFNNFVQTTKNIYGFDIKHTTLTDTALVSIKRTIKQYPSTQIVYNMVDELRQYIKQQNATEHNFPMLNVTQLEDSSYTVMVGIPTNVLLKGTDAIKPKRMIMLQNKTLVTEVIGDNNTIKKAFKATSNYMDDNNLSSPVIPFQQLVTDRSKERDSTKWVTRIFTPII